MTKLQSAKLNMFIAMLLFFEKYVGVLSDFEQLVNEIADFEDKYADLQLEIGKQALKISGVVVTKDANLEAVVELLVKAARKARVWAVKVENETLAKQFDVQIFTFTEMTQSVVINSLKTINAALNTNILNLTAYRVFAADVAAITIGIATAVASIGTPKQAITTRVLATKQIVLDIASCDGFLELIDDLLVSEYEKTEVEMVEAYHLARALTSLGTHATGLKTTCRDAETGELLEGVLVTIAEVKKSGYTDIFGVSLIERMRPGKYHVTCKKVGFLDERVVVAFSLGKIMELGIAMVRI